VTYGRAFFDLIRLHFQNTETDGHSPLGAERQEQRRAELAALFAQVERTEHGPLRVVGASWLYNLDAYRRLFPASYVATARVLGGRFQHMPLWGQFLDRHGEITERMTKPFPGAPRAPVEPGRPGRVFPSPGAGRRGFGAGVL
jgi:hypothetical protein